MKVGGGGALTGQRMPLGQRMPWHIEHECYYGSQFINYNCKYWLGLKNIHCLASRTECSELNVTLVNYDGVKTFVTHRNETYIYTTGDAIMPMTMRETMWNITGLTSAQLNYYPSGTNK